MKNQPWAAIGILPRPPFFIAVCLISALLIVVGANNWGHSFDDAFITYRYANNILEGKGFVYNLGQKHLGTTSPLYALLLAGLGYFYPDMPFWGSFVSLLCIGLTALFTYLLLATRVHYWAGLVSIPLVVLNRVFISTIGNESNLFILLIAAQYYCYVTRRLNTFGLLAGLGTLTRGEGILLPAIIFLFEIARWRKEKAIDPTPWIIFLAIVVPWFIFSKSYFGYFLPATLKIKVLMTKNPRYIHDATFFQNIFTNIFAESYSRNFWKEFSPTIYYRVALISIFLYGLIKSILDRKFVPLILSFATFIAAYSLLNVYSFHWYRAQLCYALCLFLSYGIFNISLLITGGRWTKAGRSSPVKREKPFRPRASDLPTEDLKVPAGSVLAMIALALFFTCIFTAADNGIAFKDFRRDIYTNAGKWIKENTESTATVAVPEIGIVGYYAGRTIIDPAGLVTPEMGTLETQQKWDYAIKRFKPDYFLAQPQHPIPPRQLSPGARHPRFKGLDYRYILVKHFIEPHISVEIWKRQKTGSE